MAAIPASKFSQFARQLGTYVETDQFTPLLRKSYLAFESNLKSPSKTLCDAFKAKYHVPIHLENPETPFSSCVMKYMMLFRKMFPAQKLEAQPYAFQVKNEKENPFIVQWNLMRDHIDNKNVLSWKITEILLRDSSFDEVKEELNVLYDIGGKFTLEAMRSALLECDRGFFALLSSRGYRPTRSDLDLAYTWVGENKSSVLLNDRRFFDLLLSWGYRPTRSDLDLVFKWVREDKRAEIAKILVDAGVQVDVSPICYSSVSALQLLVCLGYPLTSTDLKSIREVKTVDQVLPFLRFFKANGYRFTETECIDILSRQFSHEANPATTRTLIEIICPEGQLTSALLHKMPQFTRAFIDHGYQPTFEDLEKAMKDKDENAVKAITPSIKRVLTINEAVFVLSNGLEKSTKTEMLRHTCMTQALFRTAFVSRTVDMRLVIKDAQICDSFINRGIGSYEVTPDDIEFAINEGVSPALLRLLLHYWGYRATKSLFRTVLKKGNDSFHLGALVEAKYTVDAEDFRHACDNHCSEETFWRLLNYGLAGHGKAQCFDYGEYTDRSYYQAILHTDRAGYIPTQADLDYARGKKLPESVLKLIESHLNRKPPSSRYRLTP